MTRQAGEAGQLYGSVNARDIATGVTESGFTVTRQQIQLPHPIKALGLYDIRITLHPEVFVTVVANVARSVEEAEIQAKTGKAVSSGLEEEAQDTVGVEEAVMEAVAEQADEIFEDGAAPQPEADEDAEGQADAESEARDDTSE